MRYYILIIFSSLFTLELSAQHIYKGRQFFGGSAYINSDALNDLLINGKSKDPNGDEWFDPKYDSETSGKSRFNIRYGSFVADQLAIGLSTELNNDSFNEEDTIFLLKNRSQDISIGPFIRYYIEIGAQPYEIGAVFIEASYQYGSGSSEDEIRILDSTWTNSYTYSLQSIRANIGYCWYLSDFISHNWFTGFLLALEPSIGYHYTTKTDKVDWIPNGNDDDRVQKYHGIHIRLNVNAYF